MEKGFRPIDKMIGIGESDRLPVPVYGQGIYYAEAWCEARGMRENAGRDRGREEFLDPGEDHTEGDPDAP